MDETDDYVLCNDSEMCVNGKRECEDDEGTDCENGESGIDW